MISVGTLFSPFRLEGLKYRQQVWAVSIVAPWTRTSSHVVGLIWPRLPSRIRRFDAGQENFTLLRIVTSQTTSMKFGNLQIAVTQLGL